MYITICYIPSCLVIKSFILFLSFQGIFVFQCVQFKRITYNETYLYPWWADLVGWLMTLASVSFLPGIALYKICTLPGNLSLKEVLLLIIITFVIMTAFLKLFVDSLVV